VLKLLTAYLRLPDTFEVDDGELITATFTPPLTTEEQATFADLRTMAKFGSTAAMTLTEFRAVKDDLALGKAFLAIATPTQAQAIAAEKAIIRVLGALLRDT
jgi:hypothetical protein